MHPSHLLRLSTNRPTAFTFSRAALLSLRTSVSVDAPGLKGPYLAPRFHGYLLTMVRVREALELLASVKKFCIGASHIGAASSNPTRRDRGAKVASTVLGGSINLLTD